MPTLNMVLAVSFGKSWYAKFNNLFGSMYIRWGNHATARWVIVSIRFSSKPYSRKKSSLSFWVLNSEALPAQYMWSWIGLGKLLANYKSVSLIGTIWLLHLVSLWQRYFLMCCPHDLSMCFLAVNGLRHLQIIVFKGAHFASKSWYSRAAIFLGSCRQIAFQGCHFWKMFGER